MQINKFIRLVNLLNIAYSHKQSNIKLKYKTHTNVLFKYLYKYNYIKYIKYNKINFNIIIYINYYNNNSINLNIKFFKTSQRISINYLYLNKLNYNYLISISNNITEYLVDKFAALKYKNNGRLVALLH